MPELYDQFGRRIEKRKVPDRRPLAAAPILDTWREYVTRGLTPQRLAALFVEADAGDVRRQAELFEQMEEKDAHLLGEKGKRANVILDVPFEVTPADDDARSQKVADFVEKTLSDLTDWSDVLVSLQDAVGKGCAGIEINWDVSEGQAVPERFAFVEQKRFLYADPKGYFRKYPLLITDADPMGIEIPAWKMLLHRYGGMSGHPARSGVFRVCAWMYLFKNYALKDWVVFCEVFGMPLRLGRYDPGAGEEDKDALVAAISSLGTDAAGIISKNTEIEFIEAAKGKASGDLYEGLSGFCNREMSKAILGQTLSAEVGDTGSYAAAKVHDGVRMDLVRADARAIAITARHQLIRPLVGFNFGWDTPVPKYEPAWEEEEDLKEKAEWVGGLLDRGVEMPVSFVRKEFGIPEPEADEATIGGMPSGIDPVEISPGEEPATTIAKIIAKLKATPPDTDDLSPATTLGRLGDKAAEYGDLGGLIKPIERLLAKASSLEDFRERLLTVADDMDGSDIGEMMARALALANLSGRFDVDA